MKNGDTSTGTTVTTYIGTVAKETINSNNFVFDYVTIDSGVTFIGTPAQNNVAGSLTVSLTTSQPIPASGSIVIGLPSQNT